MNFLLMGVMMMGAMELPSGPTPEALTFAHFPDRLHTYVWRNWSLIPVERMAEVIDATPEQVVALGRSMGLEGPDPVSQDLQDRSYITVIRRNWHLLPYDQLMQLLHKSEEELAFILREDDFLWIKLGSLKPRCERLVYSEPTVEAKARAQEIATLIKQKFPKGLLAHTDSLFGFVRELSEPLSDRGNTGVEENRFSPRFCYSYFATYGDPLYDTRLDPYPDGLLGRMNAAGVDGVWLQGVLYKLAPFPWDESLSAGYRERLSNLRALVERARRQGIGIYLYLNEPRAMPDSFFSSRPEIKGVAEQGFSSLCSEVPAVRQYIRDSVALIVREVPDLAGFFTITASENLTNCWSHGRGQDCPRCKDKAPSEVIANVNIAIQEGIDSVGGKARLIAWDWGWNDDWAKDIVDRLPATVALMSVSEWSLPITRGGIKGTVGEYSISSVGPGPRATRHWGYAHERSLKTLAKVQAGNTWELSTVPYIPAVENVARHAVNLRETGVEGLMLGWTLGGYPSPNLEVFSEIGRDASATAEEAMMRVATRRYGAASAETVVSAWKTMSRAFQEFPYNIGTVYVAPLQSGPSNLLWAKPTGYAATMVGLPYDDLNAWRSIYPPAVFIGQMRKVSEGFEDAVQSLKAGTDPGNQEVSREIDVAEACAITFRSVANQSEFVLLRDSLASSSEAQRTATKERLRVLLQDEMDLAIRLHAIQSRDSRIGFEASNQYNYIPVDLGEKVLNCSDLLTRTLDSL